MQTTIEKEWLSKEGYNCAVVANNDHGHRCGYVGVTSGSIYFGIDYRTHIEALNDSMGCFFEVHGGITFSGHLNCLDKNIWWIGYDCAHDGDGRDFSLIKDPSILKIYKEFGHSYGYESVKGTNYCIRECERLTEQMEKFDPLYQRKKKLEKLLS